MQIGNFTLPIKWKSTILVMFCFYFNVAAQYCAEVDFSFETFGNTLTFNGESNESVAEWYWNFGDNKNDTGQYAKFQFDKSGEYKVCLKILANNGCTGVKCKTINVQTSNDDCLIKADFKYELEGTTGIFSGFSNDENTTYYWNINGGDDKYTGSDIKIPFETNGVYEVCMTAVIGAETCKVQTCKKIVVGSTCQLDADFEMDTEGNIVRVSAKPVEGSEASYYWIFSDGGTGDGKDFKYQFENPGTYEICLKVVSENSSSGGEKCISLVCKKITIQPKDIECTLTTDFIYDIYDNTVKLSAISNDEKSTYSWYAEDHKEQLDGKEITLQYENEGVYEVCLITVNGTQTCKLKVCKMISTGSRIKTYPNPAAEVLNVASDRKIISFRVYNQNNDLMLTGTINDSYGSIDISTLKDGIYLAALQLEDGKLATQRFFKKS